MKSTHRERMDKKIISIYAGLSPTMSLEKKKKIIKDIHIIDKLFSLGKSKNLKDKEYRQAYKLWLNVRWKIMLYMTQKNVRKNAFSKKV
jgi:hypothetical protein